MKKTILILALASALALGLRSQNTPPIVYAQSVTFGFYADELAAWQWAYRQYSNAVPTRITVTTNPDTQEDTYTTNWPGKTFPDWVDAQAKFSAGLVTENYLRQMRASGSE